MTGMDNSPIPPGTLVQYHGGQTNDHGLYRVWIQQPPPKRPGETTAEVVERFTDGVAYVLDGAEGQGPSALGRVRRSSLTVVDEAP